MVKLNTNLAENRTDLTENLKKAEPVEPAYCNSGLGGSGPHLINPPSSHFKGGSESIKILGFRVTARFPNKMPKWCLMVMANPLDLGHGKNPIIRSALFKYNIWTFHVLSVFSFEYL